MAEERALVCAPANEPECVVEGSVTGHYCSKCKAEVMVAPSGQRMIRKHPKMAILCAPCALTMIEQFDLVELAPGATEELLADIRKRAGDKQD